MCEQRARYGTWWRLAAAIMPLFAASAAASQGFEPADCLPSAFHGVAGIEDARGRAVAADRFAGRLTVVTLVQRACDATCAMRLIDLDHIARGLPAALAPRVAFVAIDTGGRSAAQFDALAATWRQARRRWTLLRGDAAAVATLRRRIDVVPAEATEPSALVAVFDADGVLRQRYAGAPLDRDRVAREIVTLTTLPRVAATTACSAYSATHP